MSVDALLADLRAEHDDLARLVEGADLSTSTPAEGWDVHDTISHLLVFDAEALRAATDPEGFTARLHDLLLGPEPERFVDRMTEERRGVPAAQQLREWHDGLDALVAGTSGLDPSTRVPWYGPPMGLRSCLTARVMEYWAHGQDVADGLGATRTPTARLRHVAHLGVRTRSFSYVNRGLPDPGGDVRVELEAPDGERWTWGEGDDAVRGTALDFCLLVTQRRARRDLSLVATGPLADGWLDVAQCFAGAPGPGRAPTTDGD